MKAQVAVVIGAVTGEDLAHPGLTSVSVRNPDATLRSGSGSPHDCEFSPPKYGFTSWKVTSMGQRKTQVRTTAKSVQVRSVVKNTVNVAGSANGNLKSLQL